jgi:hypothetical protein
MPAFEWKIVVGGVEEGAVQALHRQPAGQRRGHGSAARGSNVEVETARIEPLERVLEGRERANLIEPPRDAASWQR